MEPAVPGAMNRRVDIAVREGADGVLEARAAIEDDYHHFRLTLHARDGILLDINSEALRFPNTMCPFAGDQLSVLPGKPLAQTMAQVMEYTDARQQCTHQFDLAALAIAALANRRARRRYEVNVPDRVDGRTSASVRRDGVEVLRWDMVGNTIETLGPYAGRNIGSGFTAFIRTRPDDEAEAALVLRRTVYISQGRGVDYSKLGRTGPVGGCWAWQPERAPQVERIHESRLDFTGRSGELTRDDQSWLAFAG